MFLFNCRDYTIPGIQPTTSDVIKQYESTTGIDITNENILDISRQICSCDNNAATLACVVAFFILALVIWILILNRENVARDFKSLKGENNSANQKYLLIYIYIYIYSIKAVIYAIFGCIK